MSKTRYAIDVPAYEGPLDLLLHLIERHELDITALSLANVTNQFLAQIETLKEDRIPELIDFIAIGARLMVIKSRALLPTPPVVLEGEEDVEDPAEALIRQLKLYKQFKTVAAFLDQRLADGLHSYLRLAPPPKVTTVLDTSGVDSNTLAALMAAALQRLAEREESVSVATPRKITVEGQMLKLRQSVRLRSALQFDDLLSDQRSHTELSVTLLALLEMIKRQEVVAHQDDLFGRITIEGKPKP